MRPRQKKDLDEELLIYEKQKEEFQDVGSDEEYEDENNLETNKRRGFSKLENLLTQFQAKQDDREASIVIDIDDKQTLKREVSESTDFIFDEESKEIKLPNRIESVKPELKEPTFQKVKLETMRTTSAPPKLLEEEEEEEEEEEDYDMQVLFDKITHQSESLLTRLTDALSELDNASVDVPKTLRCDLKAHQIIGLYWLRLLYRNGINGILADEMGLGKTVQTIAFLTWLTENRKKYEPKLSLIVVPPSTLENWAREMIMFSPNLIGMICRGDIDQRSRFYTICNTMIRQKELDYIITTYSCLQSDIDKRFLRNIPVNYLILDEAQYIKNSQTNRFKYLNLVTSNKKLLLTGTPLNNNLTEIFNLLKFLMPDVFVTNRDFMKYLMKNENQLDISRLQLILKPFILRRLKADVCQELPPKKIVEVVVELPEKQKTCYTTLIEEKRLIWKQLREKKIDGTMKQGESSGVSQNIFMDLRKMANHCLLFRSRYLDEELITIAQIIAKLSVVAMRAINRQFGDPEYGAASVREIAATLSAKSDFQIHSLILQLLEMPELKKHAKVLKPLLIEKTAFLEEGGKLIEIVKIIKKYEDTQRKILVFSQSTKVLDIIEIVFQQKEILYLRFDGSTPTMKRQQLIDQFNNSDNYKVFLLSTKAAGLGVNLTSASIVVFHDMDFNPSNDNQAIDRCHRIGQINPEVLIYRLISQDTVDVNILKTAKQKQKMNEEMLNEGEFRDQIEDALDVKSLLNEIFD
eukprot:TRINITY_DN3231_c3_g1_i1.p1 TRINITY_DN3231_c3_g1~~TRINITY_DN3231_c3_g1_i1.p1  ORF type:complete len:760 (+),score=223.13 TRINITY_DN3231_c3_g1_i1:35-2281(+)